MSETSAFEAFSRMEERIDQNERMLKASTEIDEEFSGDTLKREFKSLERGATGVSVDARLLELKSRMGVLPSGTGSAGKQLGAGSAGQLGAGGQDEEIVHADIDESAEEKKTR